MTDTNTLTVEEIKKWRPADNKLGWGNIPAVHLRTLCDMAARTAKAQAAMPEEVAYFVRQLRADPGLLERSGQFPRVADLIESLNAARLKADGYLALERAAADELEASCDQWRARAQSAEARLAAVEKALEPFAKEADEWADTVPDNYQPLQCEPGSIHAHDGSEAAFTIGDLRRAAQALSSPAPEKGEASPPALDPVTVERCAQIAESFTRFARNPDYADAPKLIAHKLRALTSGASHGE